MPKNHPQDHKPARRQRWRFEIDGERFSLPRFNTVGSLSRMRRLRKLSELDQMLTLLEDPEILPPKDLSRLEKVLDKYAEDGLGELVTAWQEHRPIDADALTGDDETDEGLADEDDELDEVEQG